MKKRQIKKNKKKNTFIIPFDERNNSITDKMLLDAIKFLK